MDNRLWLALEDRDIGYVVIATESSKAELEAWFAANPDKILGTEVGIVEAKKPIVMTHWEPVTVVPGQWDRGKFHYLHEHPLTIDEMKVWAETLGKRRNYHKLTKNNWCWHLTLADSEEETIKIGGKMDGVQFKPLTVSIFDPTGDA